MDISSLRGDTRATLAVCPECGERAPFGGGRTMQNAHRMFDVARELRARLKPGGEGAAARRFVEQGEELARSLHDYGHRRSMTNPDWAAAGLWTRQAREYALR